MSDKMILRKPLSIVLAVALLSSCALAQQKPGDTNAPDAVRLRAHVTHLASEKLDGRKTGTRGAEMAAEYIAGEFKKYGLAPGGSAKAGPRNDGVEWEYFQKFPYVAGVEAGQANAMSVLTRLANSVVGEPPAKLDLRPGEDWMPVGWSANGRVENAPILFVGYGIKAAELNYDDYDILKNVGGIAVALIGTPDGNNPHGKFARAGDPRLKAAAARAAGAKALVIISGENSLKDFKTTLLDYDNSAGDAGLPVVLVSLQAAAKLLSWNGPLHFAELEKLATEGMTPAPQSSPDLAQTVRRADVIRLPPQRMSLSISTDVVRRETPAHNVVGLLRGSDPQLKDEAIVIGAHYDHLGRGGQGSLAAREGDVHHGADDNASGTAALLELARVLAAERKRLRRTIVFVAFGGEEEGLLGSKFYVENPAHPLERTVAMMNMDMVGRLRDEKLMVAGVGTAAEWRSWVEHANRDLDIEVKAAGMHASQRPGEGARMPVVTAANGQTVATAGERQRFTLSLSDDGFGPSDHSSFYAKKIPVLFFFTGVHEDYHKPSDTAERLNYEGIARVASFVRRLAYDLQDAGVRPTYAAAKTETRARSTGFRVYMGTVPSYGESSDGLRLDAVREGSPAEKAGLRAGDKIVKLAGREVLNVYDYTNALSEMKAGQEYEVEVVRDGRRLTLKVTPEARK